MKKDIHPIYYPKAKISCACGNEIVVGATKEKIDVEICSKCHPFYTGSQQLIDTAGRLQRFAERKAKALKEPARKKSEKKMAKAAKKTQVK